MRQTILTVLLAAASPLCATSVKIHGYITAISSPKSFEIDDYRITRDDSLVLDLDKGDYPDVTFRPEDLRVGTELDVQGDFNDQTHDLHATSIKVFVNDSLRVKRSTVVEHATALQRDGNGWRGIIHADGQTIRVTGETRLVLKEDQTNQITPGLLITYEGRREKDGSILASKLGIFANEAGKSEIKMSRDIAPRLNSDGEIVVHGVKYKLVPDAEAQSYVQRVGVKLVPSVYQRDLSGGAARGLQFQFYLVENPDFNAHAFPDGTVLVNSGVLRVLTTEAQFAAVLSHEIAHSTQEHAILEFQHQKKNGAASTGEKGYAGNKGDPINNVYSRGLENQADRVGLEYMVAAGYDPREAAEVWKQVGHSAGDHKVQWSGQGDSTGRRSYLLSEIRTNYSGIDFQSYARNTEEFNHLAVRFGNSTVAQHPAEITAQKSPEVRPGYEKPRQYAASAQSALITSSPAEPGDADTQRYGPNAVTITSDPGGAEVALGGQLVGKTPFTLPTGNVGLPFVITLQKAGYRSWTGQLVSVPGRTSLSVELIPSR